MKTIGAFFDFDRTLIDVESPRLGIRYLWDRGYVSLYYVIKIIVAHFFYKHNVVSDESMARMLISFYRGKSLDLFEAGSQNYYEEIIKPHLAPNVLAQVMIHKELGHILVLISASLRYLLKPVVKDLGFNHLLCSDLEVGCNGLLTGRTNGPICSDKYKRAFAQQLASESNMDLSASYAYGDHHADIPLLELVGHPTVVEPTEKLKKVSLERGWPIMSYR